MLVSLISEAPISNNERRIELNHADSEVCVAEQPHSQNSSEVPEVQEALFHLEKAMDLLKNVIGE